eukprot:IDg16721t1
MPASHRREYSILAYIIVVAYQVERARYVPLLELADEASGAEHGCFMNIQQCRGIASAHSKSATEFIIAQIECSVCGGAMEQVTVRSS